MRAAEAGPEVVAAVTVPPVTVLMVSATRLTFLLGTLLAVLDAGDNQWACEQKQWTNDAKKTTTNSVPNNAQLYVIDAQTDCFDA